MDELALLVASVFLGKCTNYQVIFQIFTIEAQEKISWLNCIQH